MSTGRPGPTLEEHQAERVARHLEAEREARRDTRREMLRVIGLMVLWVACGLALIGMAFHVTDHTIDMAFWWAGHVVWIGGVASAIHSAYRRGEARGDW